MTSTPAFTLGFIVGILSTDAGVYHEAHPGRTTRRAVIDIEVGSPSLAGRIAQALEASPPRERHHPSRPGINFNPITYRVRIRGTRARSILEAVEGLLDEDTREKVSKVLAATTDGPPAGDSP